MVCIVYPGMATTPVFNHSMIFTEVTVISIDYTRWYCTSFDCSNNLAPVIWDEETSNTDLSPSDESGGEYSEMAEGEHWVQFSAPASLLCVCLKTWPGQASFTPCLPAIEELCVLGGLASLLLLSCQQPQPRALPGAWFHQLSFVFSGSFCSYWH